MTIDYDYGFINEDYCKCEWRMIGIRNRCKPQCSTNYRENGSCIGCCDPRRCRVRASNAPYRECVSTGAAGA